MSVFQPLYDLDRGNMTGHNVLSNVSEFANCQRVVHGGEELVSNSSWAAPLKNYAPNNT